MFRRAQETPPTAVNTVMERISSAMQTALGGIRNGLERLDAAALEIATASARRESPAELTDALVASLEAARAVEASARVLERADDVLGTLVDAFA